MRGGRAEEAGDVRCAAALICGSGVCYNLSMEKLSASRDVAEHKLLILYILDKLKMGVGSIDLTNYVIEERLMNFVMYQQRIHELITAEHIACEAQQGGSAYRIARGGRDLLAEMSDIIPRIERNRVDRTVRRLFRQSVDARSVTSLYVPDDESGGVVRIGLREGEIELLNLEIAASSGEASTICGNWKSHAAEIYASIIELLLRPRGNGGDA